MSKRIILTGCPRSGTTHRCRAFNKSPDLVMRDEVNVFGKARREDTKLIKTPNDYFKEVADRLRYGIIPDKSNPYDDKFNEYNKDLAYDFFAKGWEGNLDKGFSKGEYMNCVRYVEKKLCGEYVPGDKLHGYLGVMPKLNNLMEELYFVVSLRHPKQSARSMFYPDEEISHWWQRKDPEKAVSTVNNYMRMIRNSIEDLPNEVYRLVKIEDEKDVARCWSSLGNWLEIDIDPVIDWDQKNHNYYTYDDVDKYFNGQTISDELLNEINDHCLHFGYQP